MKKRILGLILPIFILIGSFNLYRNSFKPVDSMGDKEIEIAQGSSPKQVAKILKENDLIRSTFAFSKVLKNRDAVSSLKAGEYTIESGLALDDVIDILVKGPRNNKVVKFTIPEGYELRQIGDRLSDEGIVNREKFMELVSNKSNFEEDFPFLKEIEEGQSLEGFLFPATYEIYIGEGEESIIARMLTAFENIYNENISGKDTHSNMNLNQIVTMASIIEREAKLAEERPIMAGVFYNRIDQNMKLQSCATVQYILGERKPRLSIKDTQINSPYNTYINEGIPPAPIAAPGKASILAVMEPEDVDYMFFTLKNKEGGHEFTKTYSEHLKATEKYREFLRVQDK